METVTLGYTGIRVTAAGLGTGGHSRLGMSQHGLNHAAGIVRCAFENGVNFFDSSVIYGTESAIAEGLRGIHRDRYVLSTKYPYQNQDSGICTKNDLERVLEESLRSLGTDYIDIYHLHSVKTAHYEQVRDTLVPAMQKAQKQGKIRSIGITEGFYADTTHQMLKMAIMDDVFQVIMVGYNMLNPSAAKVILPEATKRGIGILCMYAVREALVNRRTLHKNIRTILVRSQADPNLLHANEDLSFLVHGGFADSIVEAAYRFCHHTPGIHTTLTGTGNTEHLIRNIKALQACPLHPDALDRLAALFGEVDCISGE